MTSALQDAQRAFHDALRARIARLLPRVAAGRGAAMDARRAHAQLAALLHHLRESPEGGCGLSVADQEEIGRALQSGCADAAPPLDFRLHHVGLLADRPQAGERHAPSVGMYTTDAPDGVPLQWHRYDADSPLHPLLRSVPHIAYQVLNLDEAVRDARLILGPYEPIDAYKVAVLDDEGTPVELIETRLSHAEALGRARSGRGSLYRA